MMDLVLSPMSVWVFSSFSGFLPPPKTVIEYVNIRAWCLVMDSGDVEVLNVRQTATDT